MVTISPIKWYGTGSLSGNRAVALSVAYRAIRAVNSAEPAGIG